MLERTKQWFKHGVVWHSYGNSKSNGNGHGNGNDKSDGHGIGTGIGICMDEVWYVCCGAAESGVAQSNRGQEEHLPRDGALHRRRAVRPHR